MSWTKTWWKSGDWNAICDVCGFKFKASQLKKRWDGLMVCKEDWETRHPQELIRPIKDQLKLPWTRPRGLEPQIVTCTTQGIQGVAGSGVAGCAIAGLNTGNAGTLTFPGTFNTDTL